MAPNDTHASGVGVTYDVEGHKIPFKLDDYEVCVLRELVATRRRVRVLLALCAVLVLAFALLGWQFIQLERLVLDLVHLIKAMPSAAP